METEDGVFENKQGMKTEAAEVVVGHTACLYEREGVNGRCPSLRILLVNIIVTKTTLLSSY